MKIRSWSVGAVERKTPKSTRRNVWHSPSSPVPLALSVRERVESSLFRPSSLSACCGFRWRYAVADEGYLGPI